MITGEGKQSQPPKPPHKPMQKPQLRISSKITNQSALIQSPPPLSTQAIYQTTKKTEHETKSRTTRDPEQHPELQTRPNSPHQPKQQPLPCPGRTRDRALHSRGRPLLTASALRGSASGVWGRRRRYEETNAKSKQGKIGRKNSPVLPLFNPKLRLLLLSIMIKQQPGMFPPNAKQPNQNLRRMLEDQTLTR